MNVKSLLDYRYAHEHQLATRHCIAQYSHFAIAGSGVLSFGIAAGLAGTMAATGAHPGPLVLVIFGLAAFATGLMLCLVSLILSFKYITHNILEGYLKLLGQEEFRTTAPGVILGFKTCQARLRESDFNNRQLVEYAGATQVMGWSSRRLRDEVAARSGPSPKIDGGLLKPVLGVKVLCCALLGQNISRGWGLPTYNTLVFGGLWLLFSAMGLWLLTLGGAAGLAWTLFGIQSIIWLGLLGKLSNLMLGSRTPESFCWKFLAIRHQFLEEHGLEGEYGIHLAGPRTHCLFRTGRFPANN